MNEQIFQGRPVFAIFPDWAETPELAFDGMAVWRRQGFGAETPWQPQEQPARRLRLAFTQLDREGVRALEDFCDARRGAWQGFWLPTFCGDFRLAADVQAGATTLAVEARGLAELAAAEPRARFLALTGGGRVEPLQIAAVQKIGDVERVTLAAPVAAAWRAMRTVCCQLLYARFASDTLAVRYHAPETASAEVEFVELPAGRNGLDTGALPVWLYELSGAGAVWRYTSHGEDVAAGGAVWGKADIQHDDIEEDVDFSADSVAVRLGLSGASHPLHALVAGPPSAALTVKIYQTFAPALALDLERPLYSSGVRSAAFGAGGVVTLTLGGLMGIAGWKVPRVLRQPYCNWRLFEETTCRASRAAFSVTAPLTAVADGYVEAPQFAAKPDGWFTHGAVTVSGQHRLVTAHAGARLGINAPFAGVAAGTVAVAAPGCDGTAATCANKFNNAANFGGMPDIPVKNPIMTALKPGGANGGKK